MSVATTDPPVQPPAPAPKNDGAGAANAHEHGPASATAPNDAGGATIDPPSPPTEGAPDAPTDPRVLPSERASTPAEDTNHANGSANGVPPPRNVETDARAYLAQPRKLRSKWIAVQTWQFPHKRAVRDRAKVLDYEHERAKHEHHGGTERDEPESYTDRQKEAWRRNLIVGDKGVLPVAANVATIFRYHPEWLGVIAYDAFAETAITHKAPPWHVIDAPFDGRIGEWSDDDTARAVNWLMRRERLKVGATIVEQAVAVVSRSHIVHPVRDWLESLKWDGKERLSSFLPRYFRAEATTYTQAVGPRWMTSAVARVDRPGCQVDCTLVVESRKQGTGKTTAFRSLVPKPEWYADTGVTLGDKDSYQNLRGVWIVSHPASAS